MRVPNCAVRSKAGNVRQSCDDRANLDVVHYLRSTVDAPARWRARCAREVSIHAEDGCSFEIESTHSQGRCPPAVQLYDADAHALGSPQRIMSTHIADAQLHRIRA